MRLIKIMEKKGSSEYNEYYKALKMAKRAIETLCDLTEDMEDKYSERDDWDYDDEDYVKKHRRVR